MEPGDVVLIRAFDDVPEHLFRVEEIYEDCITGQAFTRPLQWEYGEPELSVVIRVLDPAEVALGTPASQRVNESLSTLPVRSIRRGNAPTRFSHLAAVRCDIVPALD